MRSLSVLVVVFLALFAGQASALSIEMKPPSLVAKVDISTQTMRVYENGLRIHTWKVSTGRRGYTTPPGSFKPYRMHKMWRSRKYDNAPMPYSVFYHGGFAIHGTKAVSRLGRPASHGCVRLSTPNAKTFYQLVRKHKRRFTRIQLAGSYPYKYAKKTKKVQKRKKLASKRKKTRKLSKWQRRRIAQRRAERAERRRYRKLRRRLVQRQQSSQQSLFFNIFGN